MAQADLDRRTVSAAKVADATDVSIISIDTLMDQRR
jgi:hypothetical protein